MNHRTVGYICIATVICIFLIGACVKTAKEQDNTLIRELIKQGYSAADIRCMTRGYNQNEALTEAVVCGKMKAMESADD